MYDELYEFLIHYKQLPIPGIGTFVVDRKPANLDFPGRQILPPSYSIFLLSSIHTSSRRFLTWLMHTLKTTDRDAVRRFNDFAFDLKRQLQEGKRIHWKGVGVLSRSPGGEIKLSSDVEEKLIESAVPADKVLRTNASHMVRVGEDEKTSEEMTGILNRLTGHRSKEWIIVVAAILLSLVFIIFQFSRQGSLIHTAGNRQKVIPAEAPSAVLSRP